MNDEPNPKEKGDQEIKDSLLIHGIKEMLYSFRKHGGDLNYSAMQIYQDFIKAGYCIPKEITQISGGVELIAKERERQISKEGWTAEHDDSHTHNELARVGALYALPAKFRFYAKAYPPNWSREWWKPTPQNRIKELIKAGALIAAEIDRLKRQSQLNSAAK